MRVRFKTYNPDPQILEGQVVEVKQDPIVGPYLNILSAGRTYCRQLKEIVEPPQEFLDYVEQQTK
jgi:hypothetical protein